MMSNINTGNDMLLRLSFDCHKDEYPGKLLPSTILNLDSNIELLIEEVQIRLSSNSAQMNLGQTDILILFVSKKYLENLTTPKIEELQIFSLNKRLVLALLEPCDWERTGLANFDLIANEEETKQIIADNVLPQQVQNKLRSVFEISRNNEANHTIQTARLNQNKILNLNNLALKFFPFDLLFMPFLIELTVSNNLITNLCFLDNLSNLKTLICDKNNIARIENLEALMSLEKLDFFNNEIEKIEGLQNCPKISFLGLSNNRIKIVENISHLKQLKRLYLAHNFIHFVYDNSKFNFPINSVELQHIDAMDNLHPDIRLVITNNPIVSMRPFLKLIEEGAVVKNVYSFDENESGIFIKDCMTISEPSLETIYQSNEAILNHFHEVDTKNIETTKLEIVKLVLIGNSRSGKTNFCEYLMTGQITENSTSTHLLNIKNFKAPFLKSPSGNELMLNIFDFGGQDYYHDVHKIFYSADTAYILLWDKNGNIYDSKEEEITTTEKIIYENYPLEYWLESVKYRVGSRSFENYFVRNREKENAPANVQEVAPILILQNKIDEGEAWLDQNKLESKYPNIKGFYNLSLKGKKRTLILEEVLCDFFLSLNLAARQLRSYENELILSISTEAGKQALEILPIETFYNKCKVFMEEHYPQIDFTIDHAIIIAQILNNIGVYFFDRDDSVIYTNISELNSHIKAVMQIARIGNDQGFFSKNQLLHIPYLDNILKLLCKNNSIVSIKDEIYVAPQFLPLVPNESIKFFLKTFCHTNVRYIFKTFFHKSILLDLFGKYINETNNDVSELSLRYFPFWRNGIIIRRETSDDMVFVEFEKNKEKGGVIYIKTMNPFNRFGLEGEIDRDLQTICDGWTYERELSTNGRQYFSHSELKQYNTEMQYSFKRDKISFKLAAFKNIEYFDKIPKKMFVSYSSKDGDFVTRFFVHLKSLQDSRKISPWYDRMITPGTKWDDVIQDELSNADMIVFLLSPDFLATDYIMNVELPQSIKLVDEKGARLMFIQLKPCLWKEHEIITRFQQTSDSRLVEKRIIEIGSPDNDTEWVNIVEVILKELNPK